MKHQSIYLIGDLSLESEKLSTNDQSLQKTSKQSVQSKNLLDNAFQVLKCSIAISEEDPKFPIFLPLINYIASLKSSEGLTALHLAAQNGHKEMMNLLISGGANINAQTQDSFTPLHFAAHKGQVDLIYSLLSESLSESANVNITSFEGTTPLHYAAQNGHVETVALLLSARTNIDIQANGGFTALHLAAQNGHEEVVRILISGGANINAQTQDSFTPFHCAIFSGKLAIVELFISLPKFDFNFQDAMGLTPLHHAVKENNKEILQCLLSKKANLDVETNEGFTPLYLAIIERRIEAIYTLINQGVNINAKFKNGITPLYLATDKRILKLCIAMLESGANPNIANDTNKETLFDKETPFECAQRKNYSEILRLFNNSKQNNNIKTSPSMKSIKLSNSQNEMSVTVTDSNTIPDSPTRSPIVKSKTKNYSLVI